MAVRNFVSWAPNRRFEGFQFAEPAAAAKIVDHGTKYGSSGTDKITWSTYQYQHKGKINNNFMKIYLNYWVKNSNNKYNIEFHEIFTIAKVTKNSTKITIRTYGFLVPGKEVVYAKTKLTASQYYWRIYRHNIINMV